MKNFRLFTLTIIIVVTVTILITKFYQSESLAVDKNSDDDMVMTLSVVSAVTSFVIAESALFTKEHLKINTADENYRYDNLQLYPIYASAAFLNFHKKLGPYLSLEMALAKNKILITELAGDDQAEVNKLFIENISADTIIILGGEVIRGGKQDRMIAQDFMLKPKSGALDIEVYCVEHNRWQAEDVKASFNVTLGLAPANVRQAVKEANSQQQVWEQVDVLYEKYGVEEETKALAFALADEDLKDELQPYLDKLKTIRWPTDVVGVIVGVIAVRGNEIVGCDVFAQHALFTRYYGALLKSYCGNVYNARHKGSLPYDAVSEYFANVFRNETSLETAVRENGTQLMQGKYRIHAGIY
jgi:hypothetical protein